MTMTFKTWQFFLQAPFLIHTFQSVEGVRGGEEGIKTLHILLILSYELLSLLSAIVP